MNNKTFGEVVELWLADKKQYVKKSTYCAYSLIATNHLVQEFASLDEVTDASVQEFIFAKLQQGLSRKSVKDILLVLKMILRYAVKCGYVAKFQMDVHLPAEKTPHKVKVLTREEQRTVMNHVRDNFSFMNLGIYICLSAGLRIGEICALVWDDIDVDAGVINISRTLQRVYVLEGSKKHTELLIGPAKSRNSIREIPIARELMTMVKPLKKVVNGSFYVLTNSEQPTEPRTYRNYYKRLMDQLDMPHLNFHGLRHSFATRCIESKCDYKTVSVLLGHASISTTLNLYVHPNIEQKKKCIERMFRTLR